MPANISKVFDGTVIKWPSQYKKKEEHIAEISRLIDSLESIQLNHGPTILRLDSLEQLGPVVTGILHEVRWSTLVHTYSLLAKRLNVLLSPHWTGVPTCLLDKGIWFFSSYNADQPSDARDIYHALSMAFWWVDFGEYRKRPKSPRLSIVPTIAQQVPEKVVQALTLWEDARQDYLIKFENLLWERIATIQSKTNKAALASIVPTVDDIAIDSNWRVTLSSVWHRKIGWLDESMRSVLDEVLLDVRWY